ncbi:MAG: membrane dipeptidase [Acidobacteria bacterium]|nr:membrane dipeptidase [Acidobacteriota bacterium]
MPVRPLILSFLLLGLALAAPAQTRDLHREAFVFDGHVHVINRQLYLGGDIGERYPDGQVDLPRIREGGIDAFLLSLFSSEEYYPRRFEVKHTLRLVNLALEQIERNRATIELALKASDIERINRAGKTAAVMDLEGGFDLDGDLGVLGALYRLGLRSAMLPAHNFTNGFADSCCAPARWGGLNEQGRKVIREMNRLGIMINVAHGSEETILQAVEASADPVIFSHGGSRSIVDTARSISDRAARRLAAGGGVVGLHFGNSFHNRAYFEWRQKGKPFGDISAMLTRYGRFETIEELDREAAKKYPDRPMSVPEPMRMGIEGLVAVIDHWVKLLGEDHVALGCDFDGGPEPPRGMKDIRDYPQITAALERKGYSEPRIQKILGLNLLRVFRRVTER